ncbi:MAG: S-methyl-5'-thioadenosine phosphorylase [Bacteroidetes bacterium]|nr:MAG: S-methyl-5'-thioadenosine phosphorylase [Bacteroidota bacterium]
MKGLHAKIGVIGGSGLYDLDGLEKIDEKVIETPYGLPSDAILIGRYADKELAFLPRHGRGHFLPPHQVPSRANMAALKMLGVEQIIAFSAVGSLREELPPRDFILPSQIIDRTKGIRPFTFFEDGIVVHTTFGDPFSEHLADIIWSERRAISDATMHRNKTLVCMEGPIFSTRAESLMYRQLGGDIINMSVLPEAKLAAELEMDYQMVCMSTDYDSWKIEEEAVTAEFIIGNLNANAANARNLLKAVIPHLGDESSRKGTIRNAVITAPEKRNPETVKKLNQLLPGYF